MVTQKEVDAAPDRARPVRIKIKFADGHEDVARGVGARAIFRKMLNGEEYEQKQAARLIRPK